MRVELLCSAALSGLKKVERNQYGLQNVTVNAGFEYIPVNELIEGDRE